MRPALMFGDLHEWLERNRQFVSQAKIQLPEDARTEPAKKPRIAPPMSSPAPTTIQSVVPKKNLPSEQSAMKAMKKPHVIQSSVPEKTSSEKSTPKKDLILQSVVPEKKPASEPSVNKTTVSEKKQATLSTTCHVKQPTVLTSFELWKTCRSSTVLNTEFATNGCELATPLLYENRQIQYFTAMYDRAILPGGRSVGTDKNCRNLKPQKMLPVILPTRPREFADKQKRSAQVRETFTHLWFRVCFIDDEDEKYLIVHFKDLMSHNTTPEARCSLRALLNVLFQHISNGKDNVMAVFTFALRKLFDV